MTAAFLLLEAIVRLGLIVFVLLVAVVLGVAATTVFSDR